MADFGIKISKEGYDVKIATEQQLAFSSQFAVLKSTIYGEITASAGVVYTIAHGLGYRPAFEVWAKATTGTYRFKLPRWFLGSDPVTGGVQGFCYADDTNLSIYVGVNASVYVYIFVDPIT